MQGRPTGRWSVIGYARLGTDDDGRISTSTIRVGRFEKKTHYYCEKKNHYYCEKKTLLLWKKKP